MRVPRKLRIDFAIPRGKIISEKIDDWIKTNLKDKTIISVGDVVTASILSNGLKPHLSIVDMKTRRNDASFTIVSSLINKCRLHRVSNPPGKISLNAINLVCKLLERTDPLNCHIIIVDGEEDMLALPTLSCAPEGSIVVYGVPSVGIAVFLIDNAIRYLASNRLLYLEPVECM